MNILVPIKWLNEICKTNLTTAQIAEYLTLKSSSVERVMQVEGEDVMDVEITPNRGDNLSILGIARELYAICLCEGIEADFKNPLDQSKVGTIPILDLKKGKKEEKLDIKISDAKINPKFCAIVIDNVKIQPSNLYIQKKLTQAGIRPINNIVDITNYIMIMTGQPMHAFDFEKIKNGEMFVTTSKVGDELTTLDGVKRILPENSIIIKDSEKIYDLCGIMGGENSAISDNTKSVVLFTQIYNAQMLRKTSLKLNHRTEAVLRFEKGIDKTIQDKSLLLALSILKKELDFEIASTFYDVGDVKDLKSEKTKVTLDLKKLEVYADCKIPNKTCEDILKALQFKILKSNLNEIEVEVPPHREGDIQINEDLIEEIVRIYGYNKIGLLLPKNSKSEDIFLNINFVEREVKKYLKSVGFNEVYTMSMVPETSVSKSRAIRIDNPMGKDMEYMRTSHKPSLLEALKNKKNVINIFEISNVYIKQKRTEDLPKEILRLCILSSSEKSETKINETIKNIFKLLNIQNYKLKYTKNKANIIISKKIIGHIEFENSYSYLQINFAPLVVNYNKYPFIPAENKYKTYIEDLTIHTPLNTFFENIKGKLSQLDSNIAQIEYKDSFEKEGKRALTLSFYFTDIKRDLEENDVKEIRNKLIKYIESNLGYSVDKPTNYS
ncbi:phenylalanine--tRNA ligase subunit beta [Patescibacteria group bacterium]|nr:phenylalanine--tRNA ligase subunit beta [Patescibacteria group bacterium]